MVDEMVQEKRAQCVRAFGHSSFCDCLSSEMPVGASFLTCVRVVTTTKDALSYSDLDKDDRQLVDTIIKARELCVRKGHAAQWK